MTEEKLMYCPPGGKPEYIVEPPTLRDWFAMAVMTGYIANPTIATKSPSHLIAFDCYAMADLMLKAREQNANKD